MPHQWKFRRLMYIFSPQTCPNFMKQSLTADSFLRQCNQASSFFRLDCGGGDSEGWPYSRLLRVIAALDYWPSNTILLYSYLFPLALVLIPLQSLVPWPRVYQCSHPFMYSVPDARHYYPLIINASQAIRVLTSLGGPFNWARTKTKTVLKSLWQKKWD